MTAISFLVPGIPVAQGSKRHVGNGRLIESAQGLKPWRAEVMAAAIEAADHNEDWCSTGGGRATYALHVRFTFKRPKSHYRVTGVLMPTAPDDPSTRPDLDKLIRAVFDALTQSGVIGDDSQIVRLVGIKTYGTPCMAAKLERLT